MSVNGRRRASSSCDPTGSSMQRMSYGASRRSTSRAVGTVQAWFASSRSGRSPIAARTSRTISSSSSSPTVASLPSNVGESYSSIMRAQ